MRYWYKTSARKDVPTTHQHGNEYALLKESGWITNKTEDIIGISTTDVGAHLFLKESLWAKVLAVLLQ